MTCPFCNEGHLFIEARPTIYAKVSNSTTRLYLGRCRACNGTGNLAVFPTDSRQKAAGERIEL